MMSSKKTMKLTPKCNETVIPDDPRAGIGVITVPEPGGFNHDAVFDTDDPPGTTPAASTNTDSQFECVGDGVVVHFILRYIGTTPEMSSTRRFDE
jgi:hypothetical protein